VAARVRPICGLALARRLHDPTLSGLARDSLDRLGPIFILWLGIFEPQVALIAFGVFFPKYLGHRPRSRLDRKNVSRPSSASAGRR